MRQFYDSTPLRNYPNKLRQRLECDGYVFVKGVLPKRSVTQVADNVAEILKAAGWLDEAGSRADLVADISQSCVEPEERFRRVYDEVFSLESLHLLPHSNQLVELISTLLDCRTILVHPRPIARLIFPVVVGQADFTTPAHQDYWAIQGTNNAVSVWIPLHDCPFERGSLMVAEGSHMQGVYSYRLSLGAGGVEVTDPLTERWVGGDFAVGDILVFNIMTVHKASQNRSKQMRLSIDCRFQDATHEINEECLKLTGCPYDWSDVYEKWSSPSIKYYWKNFDLRTVPYNPCYYHARDQMALAEGAERNPAAISALQRLVRFHKDPTVREKAKTLLERASDLSVGKSEPS